MGAMWQLAKSITVPGGGGTAVFSIPTNIVLERYTVWAVSGTRVLTNMSFQFRINGNNNYNPPVVVAGTAAYDVVYRSGGAATENDLIPNVSFAMRATGVDPFDTDVLITNAGGTAETVTMFAVGIQHQG